MYASANGYVNVAKVLIRKGADPDLQAIDGVTAAMYASFNGHNRMIRLLLEQDTNVDLQAVEDLQP
jgi:serine/threonine-protein phosphatase 6 regulatory ankyrin repeat subunit B